MISTKFYPFLVKKCCLSSNSMTFHEPNGSECTLFHALKVDDQCPVCAIFLSDVFGSVFARKFAALLQ